MIISLPPKPSNKIIPCLSQQRHTYFKSENLYKVDLIYKFNIMHNSPKAIYEFLLFLCLTYSSENTRWFKDAGTTVKSLPLLLKVTGG